MRRVLIRNLSATNSKAVEAIFCDTFLCRLRGLAFHLRIPDNLGLLIAHERDSRILAPITMLGVFFPLAVVWINSKEQVVDVIEAHPWRLIYSPRDPACYALEMHIERIGEFHIGDRVKIEEIPP